MFRDSETTIAIADVGNRDVGRNLHGTRYEVIANLLRRREERLIMLSQLVTKPTL